MLLVSPVVHVLLCVSVFNYLLLIRIVIEYFYFCYYGLLVCCSNLCNGVMIYYIRHGINYGSM